MKKKYIVRLTDEERVICEAAIKKETGKSEKLRRAAILLKADVNGPAWDDTKICEALGCRRQTVAKRKGEVDPRPFTAPSLVLQLASRCYAA